MANKSTRFDCCGNKCVSVAAIFLCFSRCCCCCCYCAVCVLWPVWFIQFFAIHQIAIDEKSRILWVERQSERKSCKMNCNRDWNWKMPTTINCISFLSRSPFHIQCIFSSNCFLFSFGLHTVNIIYSFHWIVWKCWTLRTRMFQIAKDVLVQVLVRQWDEIKLFKHNSRLRRRANTKY